MKKRIILILIVVILIFLFSPFAFYKSNFDRTAIVTLPLAQLVMEGSIEELDSGTFEQLHERMDYLTLESLDNIPIVNDLFEQHETDENVIPLLTTETNKSTKIWAFIYQRSNISNQYKIELPLTNILYRGKLISFSGAGNISINGNFEVIGLCSLKTYNDLLEHSIAAEFRTAFQQELKKKILSVM